MKLLRAKAASYEAVTGFFFAVILVGAVLLLVANNTVVSQQQLLIIEQNQHYLNTNIARERIVGCHGTVMLDLELLDEDCSYGAYLKAYRIEVLASDSCMSQDFNHVLRDEPINMRTIYYLPIRTEDSRVTCLGRLTIDV